MITKTIGSGGDYETLYAALDDLFFDSDPGDDIEFDLISGTTEPTSVSARFCKLYNRTVTIKCSYNEAHKNNRDLWYTINARHTTNGITLYANTYGFTINFNFLKVYFSGSLALNAKTPYICGYLQPGTSPNEQIRINLDSCIFYSDRQTWAHDTACAIASGARCVYTTVTNCSFAGLSQAVMIIGDSTYTGTGVQNTVIENCTIYGGKVGVYRWAEWYNPWGETVNPDNFTKVSIKNTATCGNSVLDISSGFVGATVTNCADSDNSIASSGAVLSGNITGITDADFNSVDPDNASFLKIDEDSSLFGAGTTDISAWNTTDIEGDARPNALGGVSIGIDEPLIDLEKKIVFITPDNNRYVIVNAPGYGYSVDCVLPIVSPEKHPAGYTFFDRDTLKVNHYRVLNTATWQLPTAQKVALNSFLRDADMGRCENFIMRLGATPTGFFPFGPDYGDVGDFTVRLIGQQQSGIQFSPWRYWQDRLSFVLVTAPAYALPTDVDQGSFEIGSVDGLLFPQNGFKPESRYNHRTDLSISGVPSSIDGLASQDSWESAWEQQCNQSKAAALVSFLTGATGRSAEIAILAGDYYYLYGTDKGSSGLYACHFLGSERQEKKMVLSVRHDGYNRFTIPLRFWFTGLVSAGGSLQDTDGAAVVYQDTDGAETIIQDS